MTTTRKKLNDTILSVRDAGPSGVEGVFGEVVMMTTEDGSPVLGNYNQELGFFTLQNKNETRKYWLDGGLRGSFKMARVTPGMRIAIVHTGEKQIDNGKVQTYDIFEA